MKAECSGQPPNQLKTKIDTALSFMADTGKVLFPSFCGTEVFQQKLRTLGRQWTPIFRQITFSEVQVTIH
jgi:hypothetical protein